MTDLGTHKWLDRDGEFRLRGCYNQIESRLLRVAAEINFIADASTTRRASESIERLRNVLSKLSDVLAKDDDASVERLSQVVTLLDHLGIHARRGVFGRLNTARTPRTARAEIEIALSTLFAMTYELWYFSTRIKLIAERPKGPFAEYAESELAGFDRLALLGRADISRH